MDDQQLNILTKLLCNLILINIGFTKFLNEKFIKIQIFKLTHIQIFIKLISKLSQASKEDNIYLSLTLLYLFNYSTKENLSNFSFYFLNNLFISNFTLISKFFPYIQNFINNIQFSHHIFQPNMNYIFIFFSHLFI
jgi:hypothetical protein